MVEEGLPDRIEVSHPRSKFSLSLKDLFIYVAHFAVCSWLIANGMWALTPIYAACIIGYQLGKNSDYSPIIVGICAGAFSTAFLFGIFSTYLTFAHPMAAAMAFTLTIEKGLVITVWLVALMLFLQLRRMLRTPKKQSRKIDLLDRPD